MWLWKKEEIELETPLSPHLTAILTRNRGRANQGIKTVMGGWPIKESKIDIGRRWIGDKGKYKILDSFLLAGLWLVNGRMTVKEKKNK